MSVLIQLMPLWLQILRELNSSPGDVLAALQMQNSTCCVPRIWANRISRLTGICNKMQQTKQSVKKKIYKTNNLARWTVELKEEHLRNSFYLLLNFVLANESKPNIWVHQIDSYSSLTFLFCVHSILMIKQILMVGILNSTFSLGTTNFSSCFAPLCARTFPLSCNRGSCSCNTTNNMGNTSDSNYNNEGRISNANVFVV